MAAEKSFTQTLTEMRDGQVIVELTEAMTAALAFVREHDRKCKFKLTVEVIPLTSKGIAGACNVLATVSLDKPKINPPGTLFFDVNGQPSRRPGELAQRDLPGISIVGSSS